MPSSSSRSGKAEFSVWGVGCSSPGVWVGTDSSVGLAGSSIVDEFLAKTSCDFSELVSRPSSSVVLAVEAGFATLFGLAVVAVTAGGSAVSSTPVRGADWWALVAVDVSLIMAEREDSEPVVVPWLGPSVVDVS